MGACAAEMRCCGHDGRLTEFEVNEMKSDAPLLSITEKKEDNDAIVKLIKLSRGSDEVIVEKEAKPRLTSEGVPILKISVVSGSLVTGTTFTISPEGMVNGLRNVKDGFTYFGCKKRAVKTGTKFREIASVNDVVIKVRDKETAEKHRGRHFQIRFDSTSSEYKIKDLGVGFGAYVKIDNPLVLRDNTLISMGESFFIFNLVPNRSFENQAQSEGSSNNFKLKVSVYSGPSNGELFYFSPCKQIIKIGRMATCEIQIEDNLLSKFQAHILFSEQSGWILLDGLAGKPSTNCTWLYLSSEYPIYDGMLFKASQTLFQASISSLS